MERFNVRKLGARETIGENIKISAEERLDYYELKKLDYYELKKHKCMVDKGCSKLLEQRKQA
jgi:hypothetical protein